MYIYAKICAKYRTVHFTTWILDASPLLKWKDYTYSPSYLQRHLLFIAILARLVTVLSFNLGTKSSNRSICRPDVGFLVIRWKVLFMV